MEPTLSSTTEPPRREYTWDDFVTLDEDDLRELVDGDLVEIEMPSPRHEFIVALLIARLVAWTERTKGGFVFASGYKVRVNARRGFMPDVQFFRPGNEPGEDQEEGLTTGRPDLVVEVMSPSSRRYDRIVKFNSYAQLGVSEYWIVDPDAFSLERLVLQDGRYLTTDALAGDAVFKPESFVDLEIKLTDLWKPFQSGAKK